MILWTGRRDDARENMVSGRGCSLRARPALFALPGAAPVPVRARRDHARQQPVARRPELDSPRLRGRFGIVGGAPDWRPRDLARRGMDLLAHRAAQPAADLDPRRRTRAPVACSPAPACSRASHPSAGSARGWACAVARGCAAVFRLTARRTDARGRKFAGIAQRRGRALPAGNLLLGDSPASRTGPGCSRGAAPPVRARRSAGATAHAGAGWRWRPA